MTEREQAIKHQVRVMLGLADHNEADVKTADGLDSDEQVRVRIAALCFLPPPEHFHLGLISLWGAATEPLRAFTPAGAGTDKEGALAYALYSLLRTAMLLAVDREFDQNRQSALVGEVVEVALALVERLGGTDHAA